MLTDKVFLIRKERGEPPSLLLNTTEERQAKAGDQEEPCESASPVLWGQAVMWTSGTGALISALKSWHTVKVIPQSETAVIILAKIYVAHGD